MGCRRSSRARSADSYPQFSPWGQAARRLNSQSAGNSCRRSLAVLRSGAGVKRALHGWVGIHTWYSIMAPRISSTRLPSFPEFSEFLKIPSTFPCFSSGSRSRRAWYNFLPIRIRQVLRFILVEYGPTVQTCFSFLAPRCHLQERACRAARQAHQSGVPTIRSPACLPSCAVGPMSVESRI